MKLIFILAIIVFNPKLFNQEITWKRTENLEDNLEIRLFRSTQVINLPSSETYQEGDFEYEISHRFLPAIDDKDKFFGLDGPAYIRFSLSYGISNRLVATLGRENQNGNLDFSIKYKLLQFHNPLFPAQFTLRIGSAWSTNVNLNNRKLFDSENFQFYSQLIFNTLFNRTIGLGIVPTYLYNSNVFSDERYYSFTLGSYTQIYLSENISIMLEWNPTITGYRSKYNPVAIGFELDTGGGHFFKFILTNSVDLNTPHFINGASRQFLKDSPNFGFNITRIL